MAEESGWAPARRTVRPRPERRRPRGAIRDALERIVDRHEILRTTFVRREGLKVPNQVVNDRLEIGWVERDGRRADDGASGARRRSRRARGPWPSPDGRRLLELTIPAVCSDAGSLALLASELRGRARRRSATGNRARAVRRLRRVAKRAVAGRGRRVGGRRIAGFAGASVRPDVETSDALPTARGGAARRSTWSPVARPPVGVTEAMFVEACWHALSRGCRAARSVLVGAVLDGRRQEELADAVGPYAQVLPLVTPSKRRTSIAEVADQVRRARSSARAAAGHSGRPRSSSRSRRAAKSASPHVELPSGGSRRGAPRGAGAVPRAILWITAAAARGRSCTSRPSSRTPGRPDCSRARSYAVVRDRGELTITVPRRGVSLTTGGARRSEPALFVERLGGTRRRDDRDGAVRRGRRSGPRTRSRSSPPDATLTYARARCPREPARRPPAGSSGSERDTPVGALHGALGELDRRPPRRAEGRRRLRPAQLRASGGAARAPAHGDAGAPCCWPSRA